MKTDKSNEILYKFLEEGAKEKDTSIEEFADYLMKDEEWSETSLVRNEFFEKLGRLLSEDYWDIDQINDLCSNPNKSVVLKGHASVTVQISDLIKHPKFSEIINELLGDKKRPPSKAKINSFIDNAMSIAIKDKDGKGNRSNAGLFTSVVLTSVFPDHFVEFRQGRWKNFAEKFEFEKYSKDKSDYAEMIYWAGDVAKEFSSLKAFKKFFPVEHPLWLTSAICYLIEKHPFYKRIIEKARGDLLDGIRSENILEEELEEEEEMNADLYEQIELLLNYNPQIVLYGPPGSGKTFCAKRFVEFIGEYEDCPGSAGIGESPVFS